jgi:hypothetical protein
MKNLKKDLAHGEGNRVAEDQSVLGDGSQPEHHAHVSRQTPLETKKKEFSASQAARLGTQLAPDINPERQARTTRLRRAKDVRPL